ncbi:hypothetical protein [Shimia abyssi]|uniref:SH3 domain-containing protein n=1 Tax=Shimia abyssi TaxID=1662395 RepID=A0A2P8F8G7_9RHOB|nr:hypothetical protein [Shimia abyssi]PSL18014.1 hypothetical protein CLV88_11385 [Shimia abyssi]
MIRAFAFLLAFSPGAVIASEFPALYHVIDVAEDDSLNIRTDPNSSAPIIDTFPHDAQDIEVITTNQTRSWAMVALPEATGWTSLRYLERSHPNSWTHSNTGLTCSGTEPFWLATLAPDRKALTYQFFDDPPRDIEISWIITPENYTGGSLGLSASSAKAHAFASLTAGICSDGMSDRSYGISINLFLTDPAHTIGYTGCCSLQTR